MATIPPPLAAGAAANSRAESGSARLREPHLFRFGLRKLIAFVSAATLLCGLMSVLPGAWPWVVASLVALVGAHLLGAVVGSRLRDTSPETQAWLVLKGFDPPPAVVDRTEAATRMPQATPLARHDATSARRSIVAAAIGLVAGVLAGAGGIGLLCGDQATWPGVILGAVSGGVLGAWSALLAVGFWAIGRHAWRDTARVDRPGKSGPR